MTKMGRGDGLSLREPYKSDAYITTRLFCTYCRVKGNLVLLQPTIDGRFNACIGGSQLPVPSDICLIATLFPNLHFACQSFLVGNAPIQALRNQHGKFPFGNVKPTGMFKGVMPLKALCQTVCFFRSEGLIEPSRAMPIQIVND